ncbi:hypothetical protein GCM10009662_54960 [Catellatospora coxensis]|uniref:Uncharacterized protein n=1 Tax=Catellatospora coxensis TaxID=310354 RepID=A0A8J3KZ22_9ACTN|nr:hypothetical protein Cco03nite_56470 [Catellatospora coxensis]
MDADGSGFHRLWKVVDEGVASKRVPTDVRVSCSYRDTTVSKSDGQYAVDVGDFHNSTIKGDSAVTLIVTGAPGPDPAYIVGPRGVANRGFFTRHPVIKRSFGPPGQWMESLVEALR